MTIKRRLFWSNILMILLPAVATVVIGLICIGFIWLALTGGWNLGLDDREDFEHASMTISELIEIKIEGDEDLSSVEKLLDSSGITAIIKKDGSTVFQHGPDKECDPALISAAEGLSSGSLLSSDGRSLYASQYEIGGAAYDIYLLGGDQRLQSFSQLKMVLGAACILIALTIFLSILITNRFLTKFVFRRIREPLDILVNGVHQLRDGNLDYRIEYEGDDEFAPVCSDFNEMALRLKQSADTIRQQEISRKEMIAGISHDIRSPLTSIQAYVEGLIDGVAKTPQARMKYLSTIKSKAQDLDRILSQLFLFSKMDLGDYPDEPSRLELDKVLSQELLSFKEELGGQGVKIIEDIQPAVVYADPLQIRRIISNILENSLKYKDKETITVKVSLKAAPSGCSMTFADDGPGVPKDALPHLFEVFYRSDPSRRSPHKGSGLGLAIVESIVRRMGGNATASLCKPKGLEIRIDLPCKGEDYVKDTDH